MFAEPAEFITQILPSVLLVEKLVQNVEKPIVIDADGLRPFHVNPELFKKIKSNFVITPHLGELGQIINKDPAEIRSKIDDVIDNFVKDFQTVSKFDKILIRANAGIP